MNMEKLHLYFLIVHIAAGTTALVMAPAAMIVKKGGNAHRIWGRVYFWSMAVVALTAVTMSLLHFNPFLLMIAVFSFYSAFVAYRVLYRKKWQHWKTLPLLDKAGSMINAGFSAALLGGGIYWLLTGKTGLAIITLVFGLISSRTVVLEFRAYFRPSKDPKAWLRAHIGGMLGSYIAAVTAFLVNTGYFLPELVRWLGPTVLGVPLILWYVRRHAGYKQPA